LPSKKSVEILDLFGFYFAEKMLTPTFAVLKNAP